MSAAAVEGFNPSDKTSQGIARGVEKRWIVATLTFVALVIRALVAVNGGLWRDEALFLAIVGEPSWHGMIDFLRTHESHPPLFYAIMRIWTSVFGATDAAARSLPIIFGVALVPGIYVAGARLFSTRSGLFAAGLASISPILVEYSVLARPYSLLPLLTLLASYSLICAIRGGGISAWLAHAGSCISLVYTHNWAWLILASQAFAIFAALGRFPALRSWHLICAWTLSQVGVAIAFLPWFPSFLDQLSHAGHPPLPLSNAKNVIKLVLFGVTDLLNYTIFPNLSEFQFSFYPILLLAVLAGGVVMSWRWVLRTCFRYQPTKSRAVKSTRTAPCLGPQVSSLVLLAVPALAGSLAITLSPFSGLLRPGCIVMLAPMVLLFFGHVLLILSDRKLGMVSQATLAAVLFTYGLGLLILLQYPRSNARELAQSVEMAVRPDDLLIIIPGSLSSSFNRYFEPDIAQVNFPEAGRHLTFSFSDVGKRMSDPGALQRAIDGVKLAAQANRRVWLISEQKYFVRASTAPMSDTLSKRRYGSIALVRLDQIRQQLRLDFGEPQLVRTSISEIPLLENYQAYLFSNYSGRVRSK